MIWLTWRQFRVQAAVVLAAVAATAVALVLTGPDLRDLARTAGADFLKQVAAVERADRMLYMAGIAVLYVVPVVIGVFWGAPLISRELETGTHRLVWNQTITRRRWLATKVGLTGLAAIAGTGLLSLAVTWWARPIDRAADGVAGQPDFGLVRLAPVVFGARGLVPVGYAALALALGVTAGVLIRRAVPAMAVTLVAVIAVMIVMPIWVRPHLIPPVTTTSVITAGSIDGLQGTGPGLPVHRLLVKLHQPGAWELSSRTIDASGNIPGELPAWVETCMPLPGQGRAEQQAARQQTCFDRLAAEGYRQESTYQPASRFWPLQWIETGVLLGLSLLLTGFCFWWIRRRLA